MAWKYFMINGIIRVIAALSVCIVNSAVCAANDELCEDLVSAARAGSVADIRALLGRGASANCVGVSGASALAVTISKNRKDAFDLLLEHGADVCGKSSPATALELAVISKEPYFLDKIIAKGLFNSKFSNSKTGYSILHMGLLYNPSTLGKMVKAGARLDDISAGETFLTRAALQRDYDSVRVGLLLGADPHIQDSNGMNLFDIIDSLPPNASLRKGAAFQAVLKFLDAKFQWRPKAP